MLAISFTAYTLIDTDYIGRYFTFIMFIVYLRHHHIGEKVVIERVSKNIVSSKAVEGRKLIHLLHIPSFIAMLYLLDVSNYFIAASIFVVWFIFTDIFRVRRCIYGRYISRWFGTSRININGSKWQFYKADPDPFPSVPHMHSLNNKSLKLNIYTGEIYNGRTIVETAHKKDLKKLWKEKNFKQTVEEARKIYLENNPNHSLPSLPEFD